MATPHRAESRMGGHRRGHALHQHHAGPKAERVGTAGVTPFRNSMQGWMGGHCTHCAGGPPNGSGRRLHVAFEWIMLPY